jgi:DNA-binding transcriptional regulator/RsmH inhibitor MraZ
VVEPILKQQPDLPEGTAFKGRYQTYLTPDKKLMIPADYQPLLKDGGVITTGTDSHLLLFGRVHWERMLQVLRSQTPEGIDQAVVDHLYGEQQVFSKLTDDGAIILNRGLIKHAELENRIVMIGVVYYAEIWNRDTYMDVRLSRNEVENLAAALA